MDKFSKKISTPVFVLSVICALLIGFIVGYSTLQILLSRNFSRFLSSTTPVEYNTNVKKDIIYFNPGNDELWKDNYKQIPKGNGLIKGKIFINDNPATGLEFALILASGRKTQKTVVREDGSYDISVPKEKYHLNGLLIYNMSESIDDKFLINKMAMEENLSLFLADADGEAIEDEYFKLEKEFGSKKAAEKLLENLSTSSSLSDRFSFTVGNQPLELPGFHYRDPLRLISPSINSTVVLDNLKFIWEPVEHAAHYKVSVTSIDIKGASIHYIPVISHSFIKENQISYKKMLESTDKAELKEKCYEKLELGKVYGYKVIAYDSSNRVITTSSLGLEELAKFSVKEKL